VTSSTFPQAAKSAILAEALQFVDHLNFTITREQEYPSRPALMEQVWEVERAARLLLEVLADLRLRALLLDETEHETAPPAIPEMSGDLSLLTAEAMKPASPPANTTKIIYDSSPSSEPQPPLETFEDDELALAHGLRDIASRAARVRERNPPRKGRGKLYPLASVGPDALEFCALIVGMISQRHLSVWPGSKNPTAWAVCEELWTQSSGTPHGGPAARAGSLSAWRRHLSAAKKYLPPNPAGAHVQRMLSDPAPRSYSARYQRNAAQSIDTAATRGTRKTGESRHFKAK
jgi:hypothetical protein